VNEASDNRAGVSNGGSVTGNFGADGWTRSELGGTKDGWTGYNILNQGQTAKGTVELSKAELLAAGFDLDVAVIAKYNDPRGGANAAAKKANRLPPASADTTKFAYRMPHGAMDVSGVSFNTVLGQFLDDAPSAATLCFNVVDWDARATETTSPALKDDTDPTHVAIGEAGLPDLSVCIPGVLGDATVTDDWDSSSDVYDDDSIYGGDATPDSGQPGDSLYYSKSVTETILTGQTPGTYTGMARATDVEVANITDPFFVIELDGGLAPLSTNIPAPIGYCPFQVDLITADALPTATFSTPANVLSGFATTTTVSVDTANDADGDPIAVEIDWDGGANSFVAAGTINSPYTVPVNYTSPAAGLWSNSTNAPIARTINVRFSDGVQPTPTNAPDLSTSLGANRAPVITGTTALAAATVVSPATFSMTIGTSTISDPENDTIGLYVVNNRNADAITRGPVAVGSYATLFPFNANTTAITNPPNATVSFVPYATDATHAGLAGTLYPAVAGNISLPCTPSVAVATYDFDTPSPGSLWVPGNLLIPALSNTDGVGWSHFTFCNTNPGTLSAANFLSYYISTGFDGTTYTACSGGFQYDYYGAVDNNIASPVFSLVGATCADVLFNSHKNPRNNTTCNFRVYSSIDNGASWQSRYDTTAAAAAQLGEANVSVNLTPVAGQASVRLRFQFTDTTAGSYSGTGMAGWAFDNVRVRRN
ncbi:MAG: hypothetical protein ABI743_09340, partial [bacterium]